jgi:hypothetical protein
VAAITNNVVTYNITNSTIGSYLTTYCRGNSSLTVNVNCNQTNNVAYGLWLGLGPLYSTPVPTIAIPASTANTWTNVILTYTNPLSVPVPLAIYISATASTTTQGQTVTSIGGNRIVGRQ